MAHMSSFSFGGYHGTQCRVKIISSFWGILFYTILYKDHILSRFNHPKRRGSHGGSGNGRLPRGDASNPRLWPAFEGVGFRVQGSGFRVQGLGFRVQGLEFRV